jgi:hypothetical protein
MLVEGLFEFSESELEDKASELIVARPDAATSIPIDIELLLELLPNTELQIRDGLFSEYSIEGCIIREVHSKRIKVLIDDSVAEGDEARYRATVGEEFAHLILHQSLIMQVKTVEEFVELQQDRNWTYYERDARRFSSMLRIPALELEVAATAAYERCVKRGDDDDATVVRQRICVELANLFQVFQNEMSRRFSSYRLSLDERIIKSVLSHSPKLLAPHTALVPRRRQKMLILP